MFVIFATRSRMEWVVATQIDTPDSMAFDRALAQVQKFVTVSQLARTTGVGRRTLYRLRDGASAPRPTTRHAIETALGVSIVFPKEAVQ
jgi:DNA-binding phage protein